MIFLIDKQMISKSLSKWGVDGLFVQKDENLRYISGFTGSDSYLFVTPESFYLLTDSRYVEQAKEEAKGFTVVDYRGKLAETLARLSSSHHVKRLGIESVLSYRMYLSFDETMPDVDFEFCPVDDVRRIKSDEELSLLKRACEISDEGFKNTIPYIRAGVTERYLQAVLECEMLKAGSEGKSFDTIVASGERGLIPTARLQRRSSRMGTSLPLISAPFIRDIIPILQGPWQWEIFPAASVSFTIRFLAATSMWKAF